MRTTLDIPRELIEEARNLLGLKSMTETVILALRDLVRRKRVEDLKSMLGSIDPRAGCGRIATTSAVNRSATELRLLLVTLAVLSWGCADRVSTGDEAAVRIDTVGGVVRVQNPEAAPRWRLEPLVSIGSMGGFGEARPDEFGLVRSVVADERGQIYVADTRSNEIRVFDAAGNHLRTIGRAGSGPGEFRTVYSLAWLGDTLAVMDPRNARIELVTGDGAPLGTWRWFPLTGAADLVRFYPTGPSEAYTLGLRPGSGRTLERKYLRYTPAGVSDSLVVQAPEPTRPAGVVCRHDQGLTAFQVPFAPSFMAAPAPQRNAAVALSDRYRIALVRDNDTTRVSERPHTPVPVTTAEWDSALVSWHEFRERVPGARCDAEFWRPEHKPAITGIWFDHEGRMVVEATSPDGPVLDFYDDDGRIRGRVRAPDRAPGSDPYFRNEHVYTIARDSLDVPLVRVYRVVHAEESD
ncbi:MAG: type II toxin-antitoxin system VapB family antitoxin [Longimicrobiales bacterium]